MRRNAVDSVTTSADIRKVAELVFIKLKVSIDVNKILNPRPATLDV